MYHSVKLQYLFGSNFWPRESGLVEDLKANLEDIKESTPSFVSIIVLFANYIGKLNLQKNVRREK